MERAKAILPPEDLAAFQGREKLALDTYRTTEGVRFAGPEEVAAQVEKLRPESGAEDYVQKARTYSAVASYADSIVKARTQDPAGYALQEPSVRQAFNAATKDATYLPSYIEKSLALQQQMGIPEQDRKILPAGQAKSEVNRIAAMDPEKAADSMLGLQTQYGRYWPQVYGELVKAKLPPEYSVLGTLDSPADSVARKDLAQSMKAGTKALISGFPEGDKKAIDDGLDAALNNWARAELARGQTETNVLAMRQSAALLAYGYAARGASTTEAAKRAADSLVNGRYDILSSTGFNLYVPKGMGSKVEDTAGRILQNLKPEDMPDIGSSDPNTNPDQRRRDYLQAAQRGLWVLNERGDGAFLINSLGQPVEHVMPKNVSGPPSRLEFHFDDMDNLALALPPRALPYSGGVSEDRRAVGLSRGGVSAGTSPAVGGGRP